MQYVSLVFSLCVLIFAVGVCGEGKPSNGNYGRSFLFISMLLLLSLQPLQSQAAPTWCPIAADAAPLRAAPDLGSPVERVAAYGDVAFVLERQKEDVKIAGAKGRWTKVRLFGSDKHEYWMFDIDLACWRTKPVLAAPPGTYGACVGDSCTTVTFRSDGTFIESMVPLVGGPSTPEEREAACRAQMPLDRIVRNDPTNKNGWDVCYSRPQRIEAYRNVYFAAGVYVIFRKGRPACAISIMGPEVQGRSCE